MPDASTVALTLATLQMPPEAQSLSVMAAPTQTVSEPKMAPADPGPAITVTAKVVEAEPQAFVTA